MSSSSWPCPKCGSWTKKAKANYKGSDGKDIVYAGMTWCHETHWCEKCGWKEDVPELGKFIVKKMEQCRE